MKFKKNVGLADRALRLVAGLIMIYFGFIDDTLFSDQISSILLGSFGCIILLSAIFALCPLYNLIGVNTCSKDAAN